MGFPGPEYPPTLPFFPSGGEGMIGFPLSLDGRGNG